MPKKSPFLQPLLEEDLKKWKAEQKKLPKLIGNEARNFFTANFRKQGFVDKSLKRWKPRKQTRDRGKGRRGVLIGPGSGNKLSRSLKVKQSNARSIVIGSSVIYAGVHNYGLRSGRRSAPFIMPKRQFIGPSQALNRKLIKLISKRIDKVFS